MAQGAHRGHQSPPPPVPPGSGQQHRRCAVPSTLQVAEGTVYVENNGIRRVPAQYHDQLFADDMRFFSDIPPEAIYFRTVPTFEVDAPALSWLTTSLFICAGGRTQDGVMLDFYQVG
ncbi:DUF3237 family protein [Klebsiella pneumoniae]|uniref:DUF3237 family protein n=1 Tax=Klebsiella pneumoniae TaxID=573 RepID=UPI00222821B6|nr:DUF3237 family protein [Klebsiella pneumoniae]